MGKSLMLLCNIHWFFLITQVGDVLFLSVLSKINKRESRVRWDSHICRHVSVCVHVSACTLMHYTCLLASGLLIARLVPFLTTQHQLLGNHSHMCGSLDMDLCPLKIEQKPYTISTQHSRGGKDSALIQQLPSAVSSFVPLKPGKTNTISGFLTFSLRSVSKQNS